MTTDAIDTAWRVHGALVDWIGKVDSKASFALAIESAVLAGVVTLAGDKRRLSDLNGVCEHAFFWLGVGALVAAVLAAAWVVRPRLRASSTKEEKSENFIFFGHLRHWDPMSLETALKQKDVLPMLSRQLVYMSRIAWAKHRAVQWSMSLAIVGAGLVGVAAAITG